MYDAIKEGGSTQILGHLMWVLVLSYFFILTFTLYLIVVLLCPKIITQV